VTAWSLHS